MPSVGGTAEAQLDPCQEEEDGIVWIGTFSMAHDATSPLDMIAHMSGLRPGASVTFRASWSLIQQALLFTLFFLAPPLLHDHDYARIRYPAFAFRYDEPRGGPGLRARIRATFAIKAIVGGHVCRTRAGGYRAMPFLD